MTEKTRLKKKQNKKQKEPELTDPLEGVDARHVLLDQVGHHVLGVHLYDDEGGEHGSLHPTQLTPDQLHQVAKLQEQTRSTAKVGNFKSLKA